MPPRYAYWTIIAGGLPTAFRAADRDELLPTFQRIKEKHPDAQMKYFARGKLWESQDAARAADNRSARPYPDRKGSERRGAPDGKGARDRKGGPSGAPEEKRGRDWRPGGEHRDPRQKFVDAKKQRNASMRKDRWQRKNAEGIAGPQSSRPQGSKPQGTRPQDSRPQGTKPQGTRPQGTRPLGAKPQGNRPQFNRPQGDRPHGSRPQGSRPQGKRPFGDLRPWERKPWVRGQGTEEPQQPPGPRGPNREPRPNEEPEPTPPPRPDQPIVPAPGPPERGARSRRPFQPRGGFPKGPRR
jgi:hypothetical protein